MSHVPDEVRAARTAALAPLFAVLTERGVKRVWLARQIGADGISLNSLWRYEHGYDRVPPQFIKQACRVLGIPAAFIHIPEPRDLYIQQPRVKKTAQQTSQPAQQSTTATTTTRTKGRQTDERSRTDHHGNSGKHNGNGDGGDGHGGVTHRPDQPRRLRRPQRPPTPDYTATL